MGLLRQLHKLQTFFPDGPPPLDKFDEKFCSVTYKNGVLIKKTHRKSK